MKIPFELIFEDEFLFAINKPAWWVVHRGLAHDAQVIVDVLKTCFQGNQVYPLHRLDRQTSGTLLFARSSYMAKEMQRLFESAMIQKKYISLVRGICPSRGLIDSPVPQKEGGQRVAAQTDYVKIASVETLPRAVSLVLAFPHSGRFHQIRRHLKHINHPIIGDANYGKGPLNREFKLRYGLERMALHATSVTFTHPVTGTEVTIPAPLPTDLRIPLLNMGFEPELMHGV